MNTNRNVRFAKFALIGLVMLSLVIGKNVSAEFKGIDTFTSGAQVITLTLDSYSSGDDGDYVSTAVGSLSSERDLYLSATNSTGDQIAPEVRISDEAQLLAISAPDGTTDLLLQVEWDGADGSPNDIDRDGISPAVNLSDDGNNPGIRIRVLGHDVAADMRLQVFSSGTSCSEQTITLPGGMSQKILDVVYRFSDFTTLSGCSSGADFTSVTAVALIVTSDAPLNMNLDFLDSDEIADYGDMPLSPYGFGVLNARHTQGGGNFLRFGKALDTEAETKTSDDAFGDDEHGSDDEDGVSPVYNDSSGWFARLVIEGCTNEGTPPDYEDAGCYVNGWIDQYGDGFQDSDYFIKDQLLTNSTPFTKSLAVSSGGTYNLRFRVCDTIDTCDSVIGITANGEIEDYRWFLNPTAVELSTFTAAWQGTAVQVDWTTVLEVDTVGFNLLRSTQIDGEYNQINTALIPSATPGSTWGADYNFTDESVVVGESYFYKLEEIESGGATNLYGPVEASGESSPSAVSVSTFSTVGKSVGLAGLLLAAGAVILLRSRKRES